MNQAKSKLLFSLLLLLSFGLLNAQSFVEVGGSILKPLTDVDNESGAGLSISYGKSVGCLIVQPTVSIMLMSGIDNKERRERQYLYNSISSSVGVDFSTKSKFYIKTGVHLIGSLIHGEFKYQRVEGDLSKDKSAYLCGYLGVGCRGALSYELGVMKSASNYMEGYFPRDSRSTDMFFLLRVSYIIPTKYKCHCDTQSIY